MDGLLNKIVDFYNNNKELSIAVAGALVGIVGTWFFNKLGPWVVSILHFTIDLLGKLIGGHFAYAGIKRKYLNWVVLQNQDLNLTGIIATGEKPKLEQVFISLKVMDDEKDKGKDAIEKDVLTINRYKFIAQLSRFFERRLLTFFFPSNSHLPDEMAETILFVKQPMWKFRRFFNRSTVSAVLISLLVVVIFVALPFYGLFGTSNINSWPAGLGAGIWTFAAILAIALLIAAIKSIKFDLEDISLTLGVLLIAILPSLGMAYIFNEKVIGDKQSPQAIYFGAIAGLLIAVILVVYLLIELRPIDSDRKLEAREVGNLFDLSDCIAILGKPGSGKSTYTQVIALTFAQDKAGQPKLRKPNVVRGRFGCKKWYLPILIPLRKIQGITNRPTSQNLLLEAFRQNVLPSEVRDVLHIDFLRYMLNKKNCLLIFDGLDEVANDIEFQLVVKEIQGLVSQFHGNKFIVTSRHSGWRGGVGSDFLQTEIKDLDTKQVNNFIENWYDAIENNRKRHLTKDEIPDEKWFRETRATEKTDSLKRVLVEETSIRNLAKNPLLLSMICYIHYNKQLPKERLSLYDDCSRLLLEQWEIEKGFPQDDIPLKLMQKDLIMQEIAYSMHCRKIGFGKEARGSEIIPIIRQILDGFGLEVSDAERLFEKLVSRTGVIVVTEKYKDLYAFSHLTFQEFYTARYLHANGMNIFQVIEDIELKESKSLTGWWREVILLYSSMKKDISSIIVDLCKAQEEDLLKRELQIAGQCFEESVKVPSTEAEEVLFTKLFSIRSLGKALEKEKLSNPNFKKHLLRLATHDKYFVYVLKNIIAGIKNEKETISAEEIFLNLLQSSDRNVQIAASEALVELWEKHFEILTPTKEILHKILEFVDLYAILRIIVVVQKKPQLIDDRKFIDEFVMILLQTIFRETNLGYFSFRGFPYYYSDTSTQIEVYVIRKILNELVSGKFDEQKQVIRLQLTQKLHEDFKEMPFYMTLRSASDDYFRENRLAYKFLLESILQIDDEILLKQHKGQLLDMLITGTSEQQVWAIYLLKELCSDDPVVIKTILEKINSPWSEVRSTAIEAFRHLSLNDHQISYVIALLNKATENNNLITKIKSFFTEIFLGRGEAGITQEERIQIIGTLCCLDGAQVKLPQLNIYKEIGDVKNSKQALVAVKEDLFGKDCEKIIIDRLKTKEEFYSIWKETYSLNLFDMLLNHLPSGNNLDKDLAVILLNRRGSRVRYFYETENRLIGIPEYIRVFTVKEDSFDQKLLENKDFNIADDIFEVLFLN
jgi:hypothetical protein